MASLSAPGWYKRNRVIPLKVICHFTFRFFINNYETFFFQTFAHKGSDRTYLNCLPYALTPTTTTVLCLDSAHAAYKHSVIIVIIIPRGLDVPTYLTATKNATFLFFASP